MNSTSGVDGLEILNEERITRKWFEQGWGTGGADVFRELSPDVLSAQIALGEVNEVEDFIETFYVPVRHGLSDFRVEIVNLIAVPGKTVTHWRVFGVHENELFGVAPSGNDVEFEGTTWHYIREGKVVGGMDHFDFGGLMARLKEQTPAAQLE